MTNPTVPSDAPTTQVQFRPASFLPWLLVIAAGVAVGALFLTGRVALSPPADSAEQKDRWLQALAEHNSEFKKFLEETRRTTDWDSADRRLKAMAGTVDELVSAQRELAQEFERLAQAEAGQAIAGRPDLVEQFISLRTHDRPTQADLDAYADVIPKYQAVCDRARQDPTILYDPQQSFGVDLRQMSDELEDRLRQVRADRTALNALVAAAKDVPHADVALEVAAAEFEAARSRQFLERLAAEKEQVRQASEDRIRTMELEAERERLAAVERQRAADAAARVAEAKALADAAERKQAEEEAQRERIAQFEAELLRMKPLLSPMISSGKMQLDAKGGWYEDKPGPLSLAVLLPMCAGNQGTSNYVLMSAFHGVTCRNDRPLGRFPAWGSDGLPTSRRIEQFLMDYGDLLVERGLLRP